MTHSSLISFKEEVAKLSFSDSGTVAPSGDEGSCFRRRGVVVDVLFYMLRTWMWMARSRLHNRLLDSCIYCIYDLQVVNKEKQSLEECSSVERCKKRCGCNSIPENMTVCVCMQPLHKCMCLGLWLWDYRRGRQKNSVCVCRKYLQTDSV